MRPISVCQSATAETFTFKPALNKVSKSLSAKRKGKTVVFKKLFNETKKLGEERDRRFLQDKISKRVKDYVTCTFQPNVHRHRSQSKDKLQSKTTGKFYDR